MKTNLTKKKQIRNTKKHRNNFKTIKAIKNCHKKSKIFLIGGAEKIASDIVAPNPVLDETGLLTPDITPSFDSGTMDKIFIQFKENSENQLNFFYPNTKIQVENLLNIYVPKIEITEQIIENSVKAINNMDLYNSSFPPSLFNFIDVHGINVGSAESRIPDKHIKIPNNFIICFYVPKTKLGVIPQYPFLDTDNMDYSVDFLKYMAQKRSLTSRESYNNTIKCGEYNCFDKMTWYYPGQFINNMYFKFSENDKKSPKFNFFKYFKVTQDSSDELFFNYKFFHERGFHEAGGKDLYFVLSDYIKLIKRGFRDLQNHFLFINACNEFKINDPIFKYEEELKYECMMYNLNLAVDQEFIEKKTILPYNTPKNIKCSSENLIIANVVSLKGLNLTSVNNDYHKYSRTVPILQKINDDIKEVSTSVSSDNYKKYNKTILASLSFTKFYLFFNQLIINDNTNSDKYKAIANDLILNNSCSYKYVNHLNKIFLLCLQYGYSEGGYLQRELFNLIKLKGWGINLSKFTIKDLLNESYNITDLETLPPETPRTIKIKELILNTTYGYYKKFNISEIIVKHPTIESIKINPDKNFEDFSTVFQPEQKSNLQIKNLELNNCKGFINDFSFVYNFVNLVKITISNFNLEENLNWDKFPKLQELYIYNCKSITRKIIKSHSIRVLLIQDSVNFIPQIQLLNGITINGVKDIDYDQLSKISTQLGRLYMGNIIFPASISKFPKIYELKLYNCTGSVNLRDLIVKFPNLNTLEIQNMDAVTIEKTGILMSSLSKKLKKIKITTNNSSLIEYCQNKKININIS